MVNQEHLASLDLQATQEVQVNGMDIYILVFKGLGGKNPSAAAWYLKEVGGGNNSAIILIYKYFELIKKKKDVNLPTTNINVISHILLSGFFVSLSMDKLTP